MKTEKNIVAALDIGSSNIIAVVAQTDGDGTYRVLAQGRARSLGVQAGKIVDIDETVNCVKEALQELARLYKGQMPRVHATISGTHVIGRNSSAQQPIKGDVITQKDVQEAEQTARDALNLKNDQRIVQSQIYSYSYNNAVEEFPEIINYSKVTNVTVHMHSAVASAIESEMLLKALRRSGLDSSQVLPQGWASGYSVLNEQERKNGAVVIDIGSETTDVTVFSGGLPRESFTLSYGSAHLTQLLAGHMGCSLSQAEQIKRRLDLRCLPEHEKIIVYKTEQGGQQRAYSLWELSDIACMQVYNLISEVGQRLMKGGWIVLNKDLGGTAVPYNRLPCGFVLTGGGSQLNGMTSLFENVPEAVRHSFFARIGRPGYSGPGCIGLTTPEAAAVMGLIEYAATRIKEGRNSPLDMEVQDDTLKAKILRMLKSAFMGDY